MKVERYGARRSSLYSGKQKTDWTRPSAPFIGAESLGWSLIYVGVAKREVPGTLYGTRFFISVLIAFLNATCRLACPVTGLKHPTPHGQLC